MHNEHCVPVPLSDRRTWAIAQVCAGVWGPKEAKALPVLGPGCNQTYSARSPGTISDGASDRITSAFGGGRCARPRWGLLYFVWVGCHHHGVGGRAGVAHGLPPAHWERTPERAAHMTRGRVDALGPRIRAAARSQAARSGDGRRAACASAVPGDRTGLTAQGVLHRPSRSV